MIFWCILLLVGLLFTSSAVVGWRHRKEEMISLAEAAILKVAGQEPLPLTRFDRWLQKFQLLMMSILGPALIALGVAGLLTETGIL
jgi:hypothetical protein